ncbi:MAG: N-6 DNA methylase, partial [Oscillochloris sp.]|nr:N-6 DNA methylase [Oscillochloris sp.]
MAVNVSSHKSLDTYDAALATYRAQGVTHEQATRLAFSTLLDALSKTVGWTLVLEQTLTNRKRPDGTLVDSFKIPRGYWEAKDTQDDLGAEIQAKIRRGYPLTNTIFEDTRRAVLYQNGRPAFEADLTQRGQLVALLNAFFSYTGEQIEEFHAAVREFQERIPELAQGLLARIEEERGKNKRFVGAFETFHTICKQAIDPQITPTEIEIMLVQHLLTERLFRTIFDNPDFTQRNVIAAEIEKVIGALTSRSFSRRDFLKSLDYFYLAIESAAATISDFAQKQTFLNTVYERFFQGFSKHQADTHGVVYTPQPIVDFMVASVDEVLQREFGKSLSTPGVKILDPCTGTGNFIVNILRRLNRRDLRQKYREDLFANEIMLLPYYIAALNIEHAYYELSGEYEPFEGICFTDTLDLAESQQLSLFAEENTERVERQKGAEITVIIGNPPYNVGQRNENDNNKNRRYTIIDERVKATYARDSRATNKNALDDVYVKFFRWAADRLRGQDGLVCYVSNNSFVDQLAFDGMRKQLLQDFTQIYHLDLHGNVRKNPKLSGTTHNVFGIQVGVGITIAVRSIDAQPPTAPIGTKHRQRMRVDDTDSAGGDASPLLHYFRVPEGWTKVEKLDWLAQKQCISGVEWCKLTPSARHLWLTDGMRDDFEGFPALGTKATKAGRATDGEAIFQNYGRGIATCRDDWAYDFNREALATKVQRLIEFYNAQVDRWQRRTDRSASVDDFVSYDDTQIKWSRDLKLDIQRGNNATFSTQKLRQSLYRPFCKRHLFFDRVMNEEVYQQPQFFPTPASETENAVIWLKVGSEVPMFALMTNMIPDLLPQGGSQCFPLYVYDEDGSNRRENITDWALAQFQAQHGAAVTKRDIFHYVYAVLHHPQYRERYAENLKRELPRIPLTPTLSQG